MEVFERGSPCGEALCKRLLPLVLLLPLNSRIPLTGLLALLALRYNWATIGMW